MTSLCKERCSIAFVSCCHCVLIHIMAFSLALVSTVDRFSGLCGRNVNCTTVKYGCFTKGIMSNANKSPNCKRTYVLKSENLHRHRGLRNYSGDRELTYPPSHPHMPNALANTNLWQTCLHCVLEVLFLAFAHKTDRSADVNTTWTGAL